MARFILNHQGQRVCLTDGDTFIGRGIGCDIRLLDPAVSREHLRIAVRGGRAVAHNLSHRSGTQVNGQPMSGPVELKDGDQLRLGQSTMTVEEVRELGADDERGQIVADWAGADGIGALVDPELIADEPTAPGAELRAMSQGSGPHRRPRPAIAGSRKDTRRDPRFRVDVPVLYASASLSIEASVRDVSRGGMFIATELLDPVGTPCVLTARSKTTDQPLVFRGVVAHVSAMPSDDRPAGIGVRFVGGATETLGWLDALLAERAGQALAGQRA